MIKAASLSLAPLTLILSIGSATAAADVTIERSATVDGGGAMSVMNMTTHTTTYISGQRSRTDSNFAMDSGLMRVFVHGGPKAEIVQLDTDAIYELDLKKKQYTQTSLTARREQMQQTLAKSQQQQTSRQQQASGVDESKCEWSPAKSSVKKTGEKLTIAGYQAERTTIDASQICVDKTHPADACEFRLTLDQWLAPSFPAEKEALVYYRAYAKKMGLDWDAGDFTERVKSMFGGYNGIWSEIVTKMKDAPGYPLKSNFALAVGGPQCASSAQASSNSTSEPAPSATENVEHAVGGAIGSAIGGLFGHKKPAETKPEPTAAPTTATTNSDGMYQLLSFGSEVVSANQNAVSPQQFEVPAGFKQKR